MGSLTKGSKQAKNVELILVIFFNNDISHDLKPVIIGS